MQVQSVVIVMCVTEGFWWTGERLCEPDHVTVLQGFAGSSGDKGERGVAGERGRDGAQVSSVESGAAQERINKPN